MAAEFDAFLRNKQVHILLVKRSAKRIGVGGLPPLLVDFVMAARTKCRGGKCGGVNESRRFRLCLAGQEWTSAEGIVIRMCDVFIGRWSRAFVVRCEQNAGGGHQQGSRD